MKRAIMKVEAAGAVTGNKKPTLPGLTNAQLLQALVLVLYSGSTGKRRLVSL